MSIRPLTESDFPQAAIIHAASFEKGWDAAALGSYLTPSSLSLCVESGGEVQGFILLGPCTDQTDIITLAVSPEMRGKGLGQQLVGAAEKHAKARAVELIFLEVAEDNAAAIALYKACGYIPIGTRKNYYRRKGGRVSAVTMRKDLS